MLANFIRDVPKELFDSMRVDSRRSSASVTSGRTVATPRARPPAACRASTRALLSAPWQVACTITLRSKPRWSRRANRSCLEASTGVYFRSGAYGNSAAGPKTWQWASTAPGGRTNVGLLGPRYQSSQLGVTAVSWSVIVLLGISRRR